MEKYPAASPLYRFKEDRIHMLIKETMQKKPVNSEFYSISGALKNYKSKTKIDSKSNCPKMDPREYLLKVGFSNGRLHNKNWVQDPDREKETRIRAPGPNQKLNRDPEVDSELKSSEYSEIPKNKNQKKFKKLTLPIQKFSKPSDSPQRSNTAQTTSRVTLSQIKAKEYLCFAKNLSKQEKSVIKSQASLRQKVVIEEVEREAAMTERNLNRRGIFSKEINKQRVSSMVPIKISSQVRIRIDPLVKSEKDRIISERLKVKNEMVVEAKKEVNENPDKNSVLEILNSLLTKHDYKGKKNDSYVKENEDNGVVKNQWVERINKTVSNILNKTKPDDKMLRIMAL